MLVPVWGTAAPGEPVEVRFAGRAASTQAGQDGKWKVELPALAASAEGRELTIEGSNRIVFKDVLVGEVWICSGQSNMQYGWGDKSERLHAWGNVPELAALAADARTRTLRHYLVPTFVSLTPQDDCQGKWSTDISGSAVAFGFAYALNKALNVPVAVIVTCWGSSSIEGWMPLDMTTQLPHFKEMMDRFESEDKSRVMELIDRGKTTGKGAGAWKSKEDVYVRQRPNLLYNAMLHPLIPYACRGMVWYQGEANAAKYQDYAKSLPLWVKRLRTEWGRDDLHFLAVMLPGFGVDDGRPDARSWAWFRDAQMKILELPHTGVANTIDLGDAKNIHPADKAPICERLALLARRDVHLEQISGEGPVFKSFAVKGNRMVIEFTHAAGLKTTDGKAPAGFWLSDKDGSWQQATASIMEDNKVTLEAAGMESPVACRYAFAGKPPVNLVNGDNLPAYPFRTDDWAK
jgi:sialate O-acetylesterase